MARRERPLDLSLLRTFLAIYETRQVSAAAERLHVTQPTVSYQLGRLRDSVGDALFTRASTGMVPTKVGEMLYARFTSAVHDVDSAVEAVQMFEPTTSARRFRIAMSEAGEAAFLPRVMARIQKEAPQVTLEIVQRSVDELPALLAAGQLDAIVGGNIRLPKTEVHSAVLYSDEYVCMIRSADSETGITQPEYERALHIDTVSVFSWHSKLDAAIRSRGVSRTIAVQAPHYISIPDLVEQCHLVATLPRSFAALLVRGHLNLSLSPLPFPLPRFPICVYWHERHRSNEAIRWLRSAVTEAIGRPEDFQRPGKI